MVIVAIVLASGAVMGGAAYLAARRWPRPTGAPALAATTVEGERRTPPPPVDPRPATSEPRRAHRSGPHGRLGSGRRRAGRRGAPLRHGPDRNRPGPLRPDLRPVRGGPRHRRIHRRPPSRQPAGRHRGGGGHGRRRRCDGVRPDPACGGLRLPRGGRGGSVPGGEPHQGDRGPRTTRHPPPDRVLRLVLPVGPLHRGGGHVHGVRPAPRAWSLGAGQGRADRRRRGNGGGRGRHSGAARRPLVHRRPRRAPTRLALVRRCSRSPSAAGSCASAPPSSTPKPSPRNRRPRPLRARTPRPVGTGRRAWGRRSHCPTPPRGCRPSSRGAWS